MNGAHRLLWYEVHDSMETAIKRDIALKNLNRPLDSPPARRIQSVDGRDLYGPGGGNPRKPRGRASVNPAKPSHSRVLIHHSRVPPALAERPRVYVPRAPVTGLRPPVYSRRPPGTPGALPPLPALYPEVPRAPVIPAQAGIWYPREEPATMHGNCSDYTREKALKNQNGTGLWIPACAGMIG